MYNTLQEIKEQLFDAPVEVKEAFNAIVGYFDIEYFGKSKIHSKVLAEDTKVLVFKVLDDVEFQDLKASDAKASKLFKKDTPYSEIMDWASNYCDDWYIGTLNSDNEVIRLKLK